VRHAEVNGFERQGARTKAVRYEKDGETHLENADLVVIAGGSWSPAIAKAAGVYIPLMPGKGYSMDLSGMQKRLHYPCILLEAKVALTPWGDRLRIGSTMEIGAINDRILLPRAQGIIEAVPRFLPKYMDDPVFKTWYQELRGAVSGEALRGKVWFGFRPVSADGMPLIGYAPGSENLIVATGHAMLGLSLGPGTGKLVAELADHSALSMDTAAFRLQRFR
jgi:D-amino-acid dehydrogenase